jgi:predicted DNA-binding transcriptional regulator AlpA
MRSTATHSASGGATLGSAVESPLGIDASELLTERAVSQLTGFSRQMLRVWRCYGAGPKFLRFGTRVLYPASYVRDFMATTKSRPKPRRKVSAEGSK